MPPDKPSLRKALFARVREMGETARQKASGIISDHILSHTAYKSADALVTYAPLKSEPDIWPIFSAAVTEGKTVIFTSVVDDEIELRNVTHREQLIPGDFGILSPDPEQCPLFTAWEKLDLILVPGVGFDQTSRARLGRGKGHYDRFLERVRAKTSAVKTIGVSYAVQLEDVPTEPHDQPMNHIITEAGCDEIDWLIGLGSNLGDQVANMKAARDALSATTYSSFYETAPIDCEPGTPAFLNAVVRQTSKLGPFQMLRFAQQLEVTLGRPAQHGHHTPRSIDIDLLLAGGCDFNITDLCIPHPEIANRDFVLEPLNELLGEERPTHGDQQVKKTTISW